MYCFSNSIFSSRQSSVKVEKIIERINDCQDVKKISIIGGEPLLVSNLDEIVASIGKEVKIQIDTNLTIRPDKLLKFENVCFSTTLDGHTKELHEKTRGNFQETVDNIQYCISNNKDVKVNVVVNSYNCQHLNEIASFIRSLGVTRISFTKCKDFRVKVKLPLNDDSIVERIDKIISDFVDCHISMSGFYTNKYFQNHEDLPSCFCGLYKLTISPDGYLFPCELIPFFKSNLPYSPPSVFDHSLNAAMDTRLFSVFRDATTKHFPLGCEDCEHRMKCTHGCRFIAYLNSGTLYGKNLSCNLVNTDIYDAFGLNLYLPDSPYTKKHLERLEPFFKKHEYAFKDKKVLDIGCAGGQFSFFLEKFAEKVVGIDVKEDYIKLANKFKEESSVTFLNCGFEDIDFSEFDTIVMLGNTLPHLDVEQFRNLISKLKSVKYFMIEFADSQNEFEGEYQLANNQIYESTKREGDCLIREIINKTTGVSASISTYAWTSEKVKEMVPFHLIEETENQGRILLYKIIQKYIYNHYHK